MHYGLTPWMFETPTAAVLSQQAVLAEQLGYQSFWLPENHFNPTAIPEPLLRLASVAAATSRIRLGTTSYLLPLRDPVLAAEMVAELDQLSAGRVILGVGRGYAKQTLRAFDVDPATKRERFETVLDDMRRLLRGESADGSDAMTVFPRPVQTPHPPIWLAAFGPKALAQAGRLGLPYLAAPLDTLSELTEKYARYEQARAAAGHPPADTRPIMRTVLVCPDPASADRARDEIVRTRLPSGLTLPPSVDDWAIIGTAREVTERLSHCVSVLQPTHIVLTHLRLGQLGTALLEYSVREFARTTILNPASLPGSAGLPETPA